MLGSEIIWRALEGLMILKTQTLKPFGWRATLGK
jgi:hypothetical protein